MARMSQRVLMREGERERENDREREKAHAREEATLVRECARKHVRECIGEL